MAQNGRTYEGIVVKDNAYLHQGDYIYNFNGPTCFHDHQKARSNGISHNSYDRNENEPSQSASPTSLETNSSLASRSHSYRDEISSLSSLQPHEQWKPVLELKSSGAHIKIKDGGYNGSVLEDSKSEPCIVRIEVLGHDLITNHKRRLVIIPQGTKGSRQCSFWIPATNNNVSRCGLKVTMQFSSCKQMLNRPKNGTSYYEAVYNHRKPNVQIMIECIDENMAKKLRSKLLHLAGHSAPDNLKEHLFPGHCTVSHSALQDIDGRTYGLSIFIWWHEEGNRSGGEQTSLDLGCFAKEMDFRFKMDSNMCYIILGVFKKIKYLTRKTSAGPYWPSPEAERNVEGAPYDMHIGLHHEDAMLRVDAPRKDAVRLLNSTIGVACGMEARDMFQVEVISYSRFKKAQKESAQLTIWKKQGQPYSLLRIDCPTKNCGKQGATQKQWKAWYWKKSSLQFTNGDLVGLKNIETVSGDYLHLDAESGMNTEPRHRDQSSRPSERKKQDITLLFNGNEIMRLKGSLRELGVT